MKRLGLVAAGLLLTACSHNLSFVSQKTGAIGSASITTFGNQSGTMDITINGKVYTGQWVYSPQGGGVAYGLASVVSSTGQSAFASGSAVALPMGGPGSILARAADGSTLRCGFTFSEWGRNGIGQCQDNTGEIYDLQIT